MSNETFTGKNYSIELSNNQFLLIHPVSEDELYDSFEELVESNPICEEAREFFLRRRGEVVKYNIHNAGGEILNLDGPLDRQAAIDLANEIEQENNIEVIVKEIEE